MERPDVVHEEINDLFAVDMDMNAAIKLIQRNERGRQGIARI